MQAFQKIPLNDVGASFRTSLSTWPNFYLEAGPLLDISINDAKRIYASCVWFHFTVQNVVVCIHTGLIVRTLSMYLHFCIGNLTV